MISALCVAFLLYELAKAPDMEKLRMYDSLRKSPDKIRAVMGYALWLWGWANFYVWACACWLAGAVLYVLAGTLMAFIVYMLVY